MGGSTNQALGRHLAATARTGGSNRTPGTATAFRAQRGSTQELQSPVNFGHPAAPVAKARTRRARARRLVATAQPASTNQKRRKQAASPASRVRTSKSRQIQPTTGGRAKPARKDNTSRAAGMAHASRADPDSTSTQKVAELRATAARAAAGNTRRVVARLRADRAAAGSTRRVVAGLRAEIAALGNTRRAELRLASAAQLGAMRRQARPLAADVNQERPITTLTPLRRAQPASLDSSAQVARTIALRVVPMHQPTTVALLTPIVIHPRHVRSALAELIRKLNPQIAAR